MYSLCDVRGIPFRGPLIFPLCDICVSNRKAKIWLDWTKLAINDLVLFRLIARSHEEAQCPNPRSAKWNLCPLSRKQVCKWCLRFLRWAKTGPIQFGGASNGRANLVMSTYALRKIRSFIRPSGSNTYFSSLRRENPATRMGVVTCPTMDSGKVARMVPMATLRFVSWLVSEAPLAKPRFSYLPWTIHHHQPSDTSLPPPWHSIMFWAALVFFFSSVSYFFPFGLSSDRLYARLGRLAAIILL